MLLLVVNRNWNVLRSVVRSLLFMTTVAVVADDDDVLAAFAARFDHCGDALFAHDDAREVFFVGNR